MDAALAFLQGDDSAETLAALRDGLRRWAAQEGAGDAQALPACIGLPCTAAKLGRLLRDDLLRQAGELIEAPSPWARAEALAARCRLFELRRWPCWRGMTEAPLRADPIDTLLFEARRFGSVHLTPRRLYELL